MPDWWRYDDIAETYDRVATARFRAVAHDLVALVAPRGIAITVLDIGTGTGITAGEVRKAAADSLIVGMDRSIGMLQIARRNGLRLPVAGDVLQLPFTTGSFDVVLASFVLNHLSRLEQALAEIVRLAKPGGCFAASTWARKESAAQQIWTSTLRDYIPAPDLETAEMEAVPLERYLADPDNLRSVFASAGLSDIQVHHRTHSHLIPLADYIAGRGIAASGRFARGTLTPERWEQFQTQVERVMREQLADPLPLQDDALIAVGYKR